ncbi:MAG: hypothetical protein RIC35_10945 [Marinoscillum sp.]
MKRIILMTVLLVIGSLAIAQPPADRRDRSERYQERGDKEMAHHEHISPLSLTEEQQSKMKELRMSHLKSTQASKNQLDIKRAELEAAIEADQSVEKLVKEINTLQGGLFTAKVKNKIAMRNLLDENQKLIFDQMKEKGNFHKSGRKGR